MNQRRVALVVELPLFWSKSKPPLRSMSPRIKERKTRDKMPAEVSSRRNSHRDRSPRCPLCICNASARPGTDPAARGTSSAVGEKTKKTTEPSYARTTEILLAWHTYIRSMYVFCLITHQCSLESSTGWPAKRDDHGTCCCCSSTGDGQLLGVVVGYNFSCPTTYKHLPCYFPREE